MKVDVAVIGGGPAGMAAALSANEKGAQKVLIIERSNRLGGILMQCIHNGFGLHVFKEELTGPEYAHKYINQVENSNIQVLLNTMVLSVNNEKIITVQNETGAFEIEAKSVVLATGCRERTRGAINVPGTRAAGIYSAGTAQKMINSGGYMPGRKAVIVGSGDIGLIMARRLTLEGAKVLAVCEIMPFSSGLKRNIAQCLNDFDIPLYLSHTVTKIEGSDRVSGVTISKVDEKFAPIEGSEFHFECDTVLFSVGLIPENEICEAAGVEMDIKTGGAIVNNNLETSVSGIFSAGNALHVHDLADFASLEAVIAGKNACAYSENAKSEKSEFVSVVGSGISTIVPQKLTKEGELSFYFRVDNVYKNHIIEIRSGVRVLKTIKEPIFMPSEMISAKIPCPAGDILIECKEKDKK